MDEAAERWQRAAALARLSEPPWVATWFLVAAARCMSPLSNRYESLFRDALQQATDAGSLVRAEIYLTWGYGFIARNDLVGTQDYFEKALKEWQSLGAETLMVAMGFDYIAWAAQEYGNVSKAEEYHREALRIAQKVAPTSVRALLSLTYVGDMLRDRGDFASAETNYLRALAISERRHLRDVNKARVLTGLAILDRRRGNLKAAEARYRQSFAIVKHVDPHSLNSLELASSLSDLAECLIDEGDARASEQYELRALAIKKRLSPGSLVLASSYSNLGKIARAKKDWDKAESYLQQALAIGKSSAPVSDSTAEYLTGLGHVAQDRGQVDHAVDYFLQASAMLEALRPSSLDHAEVLADLAGAMYRRKELDEAGKLYRQAFGELESFALGGADDDRFRYRADHVRYYKEYIDLLMDQGQVEMAFQQSEASRARTLLEMLARSQIDVRNGVTAEVLVRERNLRQRISRRLQDRLQVAENKQDDERLGAIDEEIATLREEYERLQAEIRAQSPSYADLIKPRPLSLREIQNLLDSDTALLEYSIGEKRSHVWVVTDKSVDAYQLPGRAEIERPARRMLSALMTRSERAARKPGLQQTTRSSLSAGYRRAASLLSRMLLEPTSAHLDGKRLFIVPDEILNYIPFQALPSPGNPSAPLIADHEIVTSPSLSVVAEIRRAREAHPKASREVAVLADPVFDSADERVARQKGLSGTTPSVPHAEAGVNKSSLTVDLIRATEDFHLPRTGKSYFERLIYTRWEARGIIAAAPPGKATVALDFEASRSLATSSQLAQYRIVHFATHGLLNSAHPELTGLVFSLVDKRGRRQNGLLKLQDVYNLSLPIELVVLSGCDTGIGQQISGEGLISLTRGFMYAGASRVVASLWSVSDRATANLMTDFYKGIEQEGMRPAAALRAAQIKMWKLQRWRSPYYWAAFQIQGEWR